MVGRAGERDESVNMALTHSCLQVLLCTSASAVLLTGTRVVCVVSMSLCLSVSLTSEQCEESLCPAVDHINLVQ